MFLKKASIPLAIVSLGILIAGGTLLMRHLMYHNKETSFKDYLVSYLQSDDPLLRAQAARYPDFFVSSGNLDAFFNLASDSDPYVKHTALDALSNHVDLLSETYLLDKMRLGSAPEQYTAALLLLFKNNPAGLPPVLANLPHDNEYIMEKLIKQLTRYDVAEVKQALITLAKDPSDLSLQIYSIWALGKMNDKETISVLQDLQKNSSENGVKLATSYALEIQMENVKK